MNPIIPTTPFPPTVGLAQIPPGADAPPPEPAPSEIDEISDLIDREQVVDSILGTLTDIWENFLEHLPLIVAGIVILFLTWCVSRLVHRFSSTILSKFRLRGSLRELIDRLMTITVWVLGITVAALIVFPGLTPARALAGLGLSSIAIGFAFKDIFENFFAGVLILWRFPIETGDFIECNGILGKIEDVTVRNTLLRRTTGELVVIPNATLFKNPVDVLTSEETRRLTVICGVAYDEDVASSREVIEKAVQGCSTVSRDRPVEIFAREFNSSSVDFEVTWWAGSTPLEHRKSRDEVITAVKAALDEAGIEIPFPYRTLTFKEPLRGIVEKSGGEESSEASNS